MRISKPGPGFGIMHSLNLICHKDIKETLHHRSKALFVDYHSPAAESPE